MFFRNLPTHLLWRSCQNDLKTNLCFQKWCPHINLVWKMVFLYSDMLYSRPLLSWGKSMSRLRFIWIYFLKQIGSYSPFKYLNNLALCSSILPSVFRFLRTNSVIMSSLFNLQTQTTAVYFDKSDWYSL